MNRTRSSVLRVGALLALFAVGVPTSQMAGVAHAATASGVHVTARHLTKLGTARLSGALPSAKSPAQTPVFGPDTNTDALVPKVHVQLQTSGAVPNPPSKSVSGRGSEFINGFNGISLLDQTLADNGNQLVLEPPDQGLCTDGTNVVETVNDAVAVYDTSGNLKGNVMALNPFFGLPDVYDYSAGKYGPFEVTDPRCYHDVATNRWFLSSLLIGLTTDGYLTGQTVLAIAVSRTSDPTGVWDSYGIDATDYYASSNPLSQLHPGCPCLGDQPLIGADQNGFYISTNEYGLAAPTFNGAQVYAMSKTALENGTISTAPVWQYSGARLPDLQGTPQLAYSVQPASSPGTGFDTSNSGTEYFTSALEFSGGLDNRIAVWAMTNTGALNGNGSVAPNLQYTIVSSEPYGLAGAPGFTVKQQDALRPLANALGGNPPELVNGNDDRMNQAVYADHKLWSALNTMSVSTTGVKHVSIAYFVVTPSTTSVSGTLTLTATMTNQGYIAVGNLNSAFFPSIGVNDAGKGVISFDYGGPSAFPSTAYAKIDAVNGAGTIHIAGIGQAPEDGFTGYRQYGGNGIARWGDYTAAVAAPDGTIWMAGEYVPGGPRLIYGNWGTFVSHVTP